MHNDEVHEAILRLAVINASGDSISTKEIEERREIVNFLEDRKAIELGVPKESGKFAFAASEFQEAYLEAFEAKRMEIAREATSKLEGVYVLVKWPQSQLIMDEEWFGRECHLADMNVDPEVGNSAYFIPVQRMVDLEIKLKEIVTGK